jgi:CRISPR/Cas system CMR-associated protein Cmr1 (group 7 of RAMP superfamily)
LPHSSTKTFRKWAWDAGGQFYLSLYPRRGQSNIPAEIQTALLFFLRLGGIGQRSRRGFGSLQQAGATLINGAALAEELQKLMAFLNPWSASPLPGYPVLAVPHAKVVVCQQAFPDYEGAMIAFWQKLRSPTYRERERAFGHVRGGRRASPLLLHIAQSKSGYHLVLTAFRSKPEPLGRSGWEIVDAFLHDCAASWNGKWALGGGVQW